MERMRGEGRASRDCDTDERDHRDSDDTANWQKIMRVGGAVQDLEQDGNWWGNVEVAVHEETSLS